MPIEAGQTLLHYRLIEKVGEGGMGVVWKAIDTKLEREVAIKILPGTFAEDSERLTRFEQEARILASLSHGNIAAIYGLEEAEGQRFLVMELLSGENLAGRLTHGSLALNEALEVCDQVAGALEAAHGQGVVHRDLKPANIQLTDQGEVKVLDFGLAKAVQPEAARSNPSLSPTVTSHGTRAGVILGTASYMSPDQARGRAVDKRTDVWSFGCVLYECLAGRQAFHGETVTDTLTAILHRDPDWSALPETTPPSIRRLLRRCLERDANRRLRDIGDARIEIEEAHRGEDAAELAAATTRRPRRSAGLIAAAAALAGLALGVAAMAVILGRPHVVDPRKVVRLELGPLPLVWAPGSEVVVSPDGSRIVYIAEQDGTAQLFLRPVDQLVARPIPGTEDARMPFFSPDGNWVGFVSADGMLRKTSLESGTSVALHPANALGASWSPDDTIIFSRGTISGLYRVPAAGGEQETLIEPDGAGGEIGHLWPEVLPGGKALLFTVRVQGKDIDQARVVARRLDTGEQRTLIEGASQAWYAPSGHLLYLRGAWVWAVPFDVEKLEVSGSGVPVIEGVARDESGAASLGLSAGGTLVYVPGRAAEADTRSLVWVDRRGEQEPILPERAAYRFPRISPDGRRLLMARGDLLADVWVHDLATLAPTRLTFDGHDVVPVWSADGKEVFFTSDRGGRRELYRVRSDGSQVEPELLVPENVYALAASPVAEELLLDDRNLFVLPLAGGGEPRPLLEPQFSHEQAVFSFDGKWIAYASNRSGEMEIYVRPYPGPGAPTRISTRGGSEPLFSRDGRELFYRSGNKLMAVEIDLQRGLKRTPPRTLFAGRYHVEPHRSYDVAADGRFVMVAQGADEIEPVKLVVALNWFEVLKGAMER